MSTKLWAGLDVGVESTTLCVINDEGEVVQRATCQSSLNGIHREIKWLKRRRHARVGIEGSAGAFLARGLRSLGYSVDLYEVRQLSKLLTVRRNKTDAGDAMGIAEAGRIGASLVSKVHLKSFDCQSLQSRLVLRNHLIRERVAAVNLLCRQLELFGGRINRKTRTLQFRSQAEAQIKELFGKRQSPLVDELRRLAARCETLIVQQNALDCELERTAKSIELCRRFMEIPGVGKICALTFYATLDDPHRFARSRDVGSYLGLTPKLRQSGLTSCLGHISRMGNKAARTALVHASVKFMQWGDTGSALHRWASSVEQRRGRGRARVALARKLAIIMLSMWKRDEGFDPRRATRVCQIVKSCEAESDPGKSPARTSAFIGLGPIPSDSSAPAVGLSGLCLDRSSAQAPVLALQD
jgi:transposase